LTNHVDPKYQTNHFSWVIPNVLARSGRPGFPTIDVDPLHVEDWMSRIAEEGIKSVIVLLHHTQMNYWYPRLEQGLVEHYRTKGLNVVHFNYLDYKTPPMDPDQLPPVFQAFQELPKPVLVHCSLGRDRTGQAITYILDQLGQAPIMGAMESPSAAKTEGTPVGNVDG